MPSPFEDLVFFQRAIELMVAVYRTTEPFPTHERYGLVAQLRRASVSVVSNIAEGQGRLTFGEARQALSHARGSLYEVDAQLIAALHLTYIADTDYETLRKQVIEVARPLAGYLEHTKRRERQARRSRTRPRSPSTVPPKDP